MSVAFPTVIRSSDQYFVEILLHYRRHNQAVQQLFSAFARYHYARYGAGCYEPQATVVQLVLSGADALPYLTQRMLLELPTFTAIWPLIPVTPLDSGFEPEK